MFYNRNHNIQQIAYDGGVFSHYDTLLIIKELALLQGYILKNNHDINIDICSLKSFLSFAP